MKFKDLLEVLDSDEQLTVIVTNEWGDEYNYGTVKDFKEEDLLLILRVCRVFTRVVEHYDVSPKRVALTTQIKVTLYDDEHKIIYRGCKQVY